MPRSDVSICNSALIEIGVAKITALTDDTESARVLNEIFVPIRQAVLRSHPWNCATKRMALAPQVTTPLFDYAYQFPLPENCLRVLATDLIPEEYEIEGRLLLSDSNTITIKYISDITDANEFDALCLEALVARLAHKACYKLVQSQTLQQSMWALYKEKIAEARSIDAQENKKKKDTSSEGPWFEARY